MNNFNALATTQKDNDQSSMFKSASDNFMKSSAGRLMDLHSFVYYMRIGHL